MAYLDILSPAGIGSYNRKLARLTNLSVAAYWNTLLEIATQVVRKATFDQEGYFKVNRTYISEQTSLSISEQYECDSVLAKLEVLFIHPTDVDRVGIRGEVMTSILVSSDLKQLKKLTVVAKVTAKDKKESKRIGIIKRLQDNLKEPDESLFTAYCNWIEVAYDKGINKSIQVDLFQNVINTYSTNIEIKLEILKICTLNAYRDAQWGINKYEQQHNIKASTIRLTDQKIASTGTVQKENAF